MGSYYSRFQKVVIIDPPLKRAIIQDTPRDEKLPGFSFLYNKCDFITDTYCCICYEDYYEGMPMHMLPCNHILHRACILNWYEKSSTCPICRNTPHTENMISL